MRPAFSGWPVTTRLRYHPSTVDRPMPSAAMSARLMTVRPSMMSVMCLSFAESLEPSFLATRCR